MRCWKKSFTAIRLEELQEILNNTVKKYKDLVLKYEQIDYINTSTPLLNDDKNGLVVEQQKITVEFTENLLEWCIKYDFFDFLVDHSSAFTIKYQLISKLNDQTIIKALNKNTRELNFYELQCTKLIIKFEEQIIYSNQL